MPRRSTTHHPESTNSVRRQAYLLIQKKVASGELKAGALISEVALSQELGSSRTPVREAAGQLLAEGLLELSPGGGMIVAQLSKQSILDLYELREALEVFAVGRAASKDVRPADRLRLETTLEETQTLLKELKGSGKKELDAEQMRRFTQSDLTFHALLIRLAANIRILKVLSETRLLIRIFRIQRSGHKQEELVRIHRNHKEILQAVINQNVEQARKLLSEHIQASARERLDEFDMWEREAHLANLDVIETLIF
jgi:DNA-binding GntR family transcriptional regulator